MFKFKAVVMVEFEADNSGLAWEILEEYTETMNMEYPCMSSYPVNLECHGQTNIKKE